MTGRKNFHFFFEYIYICIEATNRHNIVDEDLLDIATDGSDSDDEIQSELEQLNIVESPSGPGIQLTAAITLRMRLVGLGVLLCTNTSCIVFLNAS